MLRIARLSLLALIVVALPAAAEVYTVTLTNGATIDSRYEPVAASWDPEMVVLLTEVGNLIAVPSSEVARIDSETEVRGYGTVINTTTVALGWAANDAPVAAEGDAELSPSARLLQLLEKQAQPRPNYNVQQFAEPSQAGGIPVWMTNTTTPPLAGIVPTEPPQQ